jgi:hypothetical protein
VPKGPQGQRPPADVNSRGAMITKIAVGEIEDKAPDDGKNKAAQELGRLGGKARAKAISPRKRKEIARKAAKSRWGT